MEITTLSVPILATLGVVGGLIGQRNGRMGAGIILGILLGPVGWLITMGLKPLPAVMGSYEPPPVRPNNEGTAWIIATIVVAILLGIGSVILMLDRRAADEAAYQKSQQQFFKSLKVKSMTNEERKESDQRFNELLDKIRQQAEN